MKSPARRDGTVTGSPGMLLLPDPTVALGEWEWGFVAGKAFLPFLGSLGELGARIWPSRAGNE